MDMTSINLNDYYLIEPSNITTIESIKNESFYDIEVEDDHSFFIKLDSGELLLSHNCDGSHITGLLIGFFQKYAPFLLKNKQIKKLRTPIITINNSKGEIVHFFFKLPEYYEYEKNNELPKGHYIKYYKGLGTWRKEHLQKLVQRYGLEYFIEDVEIDEYSDKNIDDWIGDSKENCESRKESLRNFEINIDLV